MKWSSLAFPMVCAGLLLGCPSDEDPEPEAPDEVTEASDDADSPDAGPDDIPVEDDGTVSDDVPDLPPDIPPPPPEETGPGLGIDWDAQPAGVTPRYEPGSDDWTALGWPNDRLRTEAGALKLDLFPNPGVALLTSYLDYGQEVLDGWGLNGSVYFQFDGGIDMASLPTAADSRDPLSVIQLVNVTPDTPRYGEAMPIDVRWYGDGKDPFYLPLTLAMRPVTGMPLAEGATYCAIITRGIVDVQGRYLQVAPEFAPALASDPTLDPLRAWLKDSDLHSVDLAVASCFTTQVATQELRAVRAFLETQPVPAVEHVEEPGVWGELHGTYSAPNFQAGEKPYAADGDLRFDESGAPIVQAMETIRFMLLVPTDRPMPEAGWPSVLYAHGTGGDYESCRGSSKELLGAGLAVVCIDQPLHGSRGPEEGPLNDDQLVTYSFNFLNPKAGRTNFRQSTIDSMTLARMVAAGALDLAAADTLSGAAIALDPAHITFFGHSHGGLSGGLLLGVEPLIGAGVLSGAAGGIINTILLRKDPVDILQLLGAVLKIPPDDLDAFHPMMSLIQMLVDATDPINFSPYWTKPLPPNTPKHVFVTEGTSDHASPAIATDAMGAAAGLPLILPLAKWSEPHALRGLIPVHKPLSENLAGWTAAMQQWQDGSHWVAFNNSEARATWAWFFRSLVEEGVPELAVDSPSAIPTAPGALMGEGCADAGTVDLTALPVVLHGSTQLADDDHTGVCPEGQVGAGHRDVAWAMSVPKHGVYRFVVSTSPVGKNDPPSGPDRLYVLSDCAADAPCSASGKTVDIELPADAPFWVVVDGTTPLHRGAFALTVSERCLFLECGERECGDWGCGSCGSCGDGEVCSAQGACQPAPAGDTCADALPVGGLPFVANGSTASMTADYHYDKGQCPGFNAKYGQGSADVAFAWTVPADGIWTVSLAADFDANLYVVSDCEDIAGSCLGAHRSGSGNERLVLSLTAGQPVFVIVDGAGNSSNKRGRYSLKIDACAPACEGKGCGSDGCGGSCGECASGERCLDAPDCEPIPVICVPKGDCVAIPEGDTCEAPFVVGALPFKHTVDTTELFDDYAYASKACPGESKGWGGKAPDAVYAFTAPADGIYKFKLSAGFDTNLYLAAACPDIEGSCVVADQDEKKKGAESLFRTMAEGELLYVVVDGAFSSAHKGDITLDVSGCTPKCGEKVCGGDGCGGSCGSCAKTEACSSGACGPKDGDLCADSIKISKLPYESKPNTDGYTNQGIGSCNGEPGTGPDLVYRYKAKKDINVSFQLKSGFGAVLSVADSCESVADGCLASTDGDVISLDLLDDQTIFLTVTAPPGSDATGGVTLNVWETCVPACKGKVCGGDGCGGLCGTCTLPADICTADGLCSDPATLEGNSCLLPFEVDTSDLPFAGVGSTEAAHPVFAVGDDQCEGWVGKGGASADQVWKLTPDATGVWTIQITPVKAFDVAVYVVSSCEDPGSTCLGARDGHGAEVLDVELVAGEPVFIVVDGASNAENLQGVYSLKVWGPE